jgi:hypothetical protein
MAIKLEKIGPKITEAEIARFENEIGLALPEDYREFLLKINGGYPLKASYRFNRSELRLFEIFSLTESKIHGLLGRYAVVKCEIGDGLIPFGRDEAGELLCLRSSDERVYRTAGYSDGERNNEVVPVAESFAAFWEGLFEEVVLGDVFTRIAEQGSVEDVRELIANGVSLSQKGINGLTLLEEAAKFGNIAIVSACLENGSAIGEALHRAIENRRAKIARILVAKGASLEAVDESDQKPEDYIFGSREMADLIAELRRQDKERRT